MSEKFILGKLEEEYMSNFLPSVGICDHIQGYFVEVSTFSNWKYHIKRRDECDSTQERGSISVHL